MKVWKISLEAQVIVIATEAELASARANYEPTDASPEPDDEWLHEEVALSRIQNAFPILGDSGVTDAEQITLPKEVSNGA